MKFGPNYEQGSNEWLAWRLQGLGASDAVKVCSGSSKYIELYKVKSGEMPESAFETGFVRAWRDRGHEIEHEARASYMLHVGIWVEPRLIVHPEHDWLRASLDGVSDDEKTIVEIKCPGKGKHDKALAGKLPSEYWPQIQHTLMVAGLPSMHYWSFDGERGALIEVAADAEYQKKLFLREAFFWESVKAKIEPDLEAALRASIKRTSKPKTILNGANTDRGEQG